MRSVSAALATVLSSNKSLLEADLFTFAFAAGTQRLTNHGAALTIGGNTYLGGHLWAPDLMGGAGGENAEVTIVAGVTSQTLSGLSWLRAALVDLFEGVEVTVHRAVVPAGGSFAGYASADLLNLFKGRIVTADPAPDSTLTMKVRGRLSLQEVPMSHRFVQAQCPFVLGDTDCAVTLASFTDARTAAAGTTAAVVKLSSSSARAAPGSILRMTGGVQSGQVRLVRSVSGVDCTLDALLPGAPGTGDSLTVQLGCAKNITDCTSKFANQLRYGGALYAPAQD